MRSPVTKLSLINLPREEQLSHRAKAPTVILFPRWMRAALPYLGTRCGCMLPALLCTEGGRDQELLLMQILCAFGACLCRLACKILWETKRLQWSSWYPRCLATNELSSEEWISTQALKNSSSQLFSQQRNRSWSRTEVRKGGRSKRDQLSSPDTLSHEG